LNTQKQIFLIVALFFIFIGGCAAYSAIDLPVRSPDQTDWTRDQSLERGALLFANNCRTCHGNKGQGLVGPQLLDNPNTQFQDQDPLKLAANRALVLRTLSCGRAGTLMPAWLNTNGGSLNAIQLQHLVDFITAPIEKDKDGNVTDAKWWDEAEGFAHNLNGEVAVLVGGDTLATIASSHDIGPKELAAYNNLPLNGTLKKGIEIKIPPFKGDQNGYVYHVYKDNETITKIAASQFVGSVILADLNGINYSFSEKRGVATMTLKGADGKDLPGLAPGNKLKLPEGTTYTIQAGDTLTALATRHGISESAISSLNRDILGSLANDAEIPFQRHLKLPKPEAVVQEGQTLSTIAQLNNVKLDDLASTNGFDAAKVVATGDVIKLPAGAEYIIQTGDTLDLVAKMHGVTVDELAQANNLKPNDFISPDVDIQLPKIDGYVIQGQNLAAVAKGYGNVTADSLAQKNGVDPNAILFVGTQLKLPDDAFGSAPPDTKNTGTACVQYAVSQSVFDANFGTGTAAPITQPPTASKDVKIDAHANDWTVTADGAAQAPNKGVVLVTKGASVAFSSVAGLHTITINGKKDGDNLAQGTNRQITFNTAGEFKITCDFHADMKADVFVQ
jgi:LysM repeat protein